MAQTIGKSTALPSDLAESRGLKFIFIFLTLHLCFSALLPSVLALFSDRLSSCVWMFQADIILVSSNPNREKDCLFPDNSRKKVPRKTLVFGLVSSPIPESITGTGCSGQTWVKCPSSWWESVVRLNLTTWRRFPKKISVHWP